MRKYIVLSLILTGFFANGQEVLHDTVNEASVEKNLYNVHLGIFSAGFACETKLQRKVALHIEIGLMRGVSTIEYDNPAIEDKKAKLLVPYINLEPRWYYGLDRRSRLGKNIASNSSNYFSLETTYQSYSTPIINTGDFNVVSALTIIPKYGIRRRFAKHFNYEFSGGYGYQYNFFRKVQCYNCNYNYNDTTINLDVRIGYNF